MRVWDHTREVSESLNLLSPAIGRLEPLKGLNSLGPMNDPYLNRFFFFGMFIHYHDLESSLAAFAPRPGNIVVAAGP